MKVLILIISLIFTHTYILNGNKNSKKKKSNFLIENYFKKKLKKKAKNILIKGDNDAASYSFDLWERMQYKNIKSDNKNKGKKTFINLSKDKKILYDNYNNEYIHDITMKLNVINEYYNSNSLLTKFNSLKFNEEGEDHLTNIKSSNLPNIDKDNNKKYEELLRRNKIYQNNENINNKDKYYEDLNENVKSREFLNNINKINNYNYMNQMDQMNNHHNPRGNPHDKFGKSKYFDSQSTQNSFQQNSNYQTYNSNKKSRFGGYMTNFYQIMMALGFFGLLYRILFGNKQNDKYAMVWYDSNIDYFKERYELLGLIEDDLTGEYKKPEGNLNTKSLMIKESIDSYQLICGNYRYVKYIAINLHFMKKYDMNFFISSFFHSTRDKITYKVSFNSVDPCGWVFCITSKKQSNGIKRSYEDLEQFCEIYHPYFMDEDMCLISEDEGIFKEMFNNKKLIDYYRRVEYFIDNIYYSDSINTYFDENNIYFSFDIDLNESYQERIYLEITHFVNVFVDCLAQIKYTDEFKKKVKNKREQYRENKIREDMKEEIEAKEKKEFIEQFKIRNQMKGKKGFERKKLEKKLKKKNHK